eukprot:gene28935-35948_t
MRFFQALHAATCGGWGLDVEEASVAKQVALSELVPFAHEKLIAGRGARCLRTAKSNATTRFATLKPAKEAELTILEFEQTENFFGCPFKFGETEPGTYVKGVRGTGELQGMKFRAGQYIFLNVPIISPLQWHPFTISSAPSDGRTTCHIKDMGPGTFTNQLRQLAQQAEDNQFELQKMPIAVDGPYGAPLPVRDYKKLVLVAGGIGITPVNSILREMYRSALENEADKDRHAAVLFNCA